MGLPIGIGVLQIVVLGIVDEKGLGYTKEGHKNSHTKRDGSVMTEKAAICQAKSKSSGEPSPALT